MITVKPNQSQCFVSEIEKMYGKTTIVAGNSDYRLLERKKTSIAYEYLKEINQRDIKIASRRLVARHFTFLKAELLGGGRTKNEHP